MLSEAVWLIDHLLFTSDHHGIIEEVSTLRANLKEARQEHTKLETQIRDLRSAETSNKVYRRQFRSVIDNGSFPRSSRLILSLNN